MYDNVLYQLYGGESMTEGSDRPEQYPEGSSEWFSALNKNLREIENRKWWQALNLKEWQKWIVLIAAFLTFVSCLAQGLEASRSFLYNVHRISSSCAAPPECNTHKTSKLKSK